MDWGRAKKILILILAFADLVLGIYVLGLVNEKNKALQTDAENAVLYAQLQGISVDARLPVGEIKLPVLFVSIENDGAGDTEYKGIRIEVSGGENFGAGIKSVGSEKVKIESAGAALLELLPSLAEAEDTKISGIELVYWVDHAAQEAGSRIEDTAMPAWKFVTGKGTYYINAII